MLVLCLLMALSQAGARRRPAAPAPAAAHRDVATTQGVVRGYQASSPPHFAYFGIPYAAPPTRALRFESPQPSARWDGLFEATHRVRCPQPGGGGDENCLVLNIFVPEGASTLPVLVHFHDGGFQKGWGSFEPPRRVIQRGILVVTFNYRLGALGFLCRPGAPSGNLGLKDQVAALYWLQRNIAHFGGNPAEVTVYGKGAGAASIELLAMSGLTEGLFHKAIIESGSAISPFTISHDSENVAREGARVLDFPNKEKYKDLATLYRKVPVSKLANMTATFLPCIEQDSYTKRVLLYTDPIEILKKDNYPHVPVIYAFTNQEGIKYKYKYEAWDNEELTEDFFSMFLPDNLEFDTENTRNQVVEMVQRLYVEDEEPVDWPKVYAGYFSDVATVYPMVKSAFLYSLQTSDPVYLMDFSYTGLKKLNNSEGFQDIESYIFSKELEQSDELVAERLATMWSNFIKYGDPTPLTSSLVPLIWPPVQPAGPNSRLSSMQCLLFSHWLAVKALSSHRNLDFWDTVYEKFYKYNLP